MGGLLQAPVAQCREGRADAIQVIGIALGEEWTRAIGRARDHDSPRIHDHRTAMAEATAGMFAALRGRADETLVLDRARAQQHLPVVATRLACECGGYAQEARVAQREAA